MSMKRTNRPRPIEENLQSRPCAKAEPAKRRQARLLVFKGSGGLLAGVNPLSNKALLAALDDDA